MAAIYGRNGSATSTYVGYTPSNDQQVQQFTPVSSLISHVWKKLAWENSSLQNLAEYYEWTNIAGAGKGYMRTWSSSIYSDEVRRLVEKGLLVNGSTWDEWSFGF